MFQSIYTASSGLMAQELQMDVLANDLSNISTTGYKKKYVDFKDLLYKERGNAVNDSNEDAFTQPIGIRVGTGVRDVSISRIHSQGTLMQTEAPLNVAINGIGFFVIETSDGKLRYTRDGSFKKNANGDLVTVEGHSVSPGITIPDNAISISIDVGGLVTIIDDSETQVELGTLDMVRFINEAGLAEVGSNFYVETEASGAPIYDEAGQNGMGDIMQYFLEMSNVQAIEAMLQMIKIHRAFDLSLKCMNSASDMLSDLISVQNASV